MTTNLGCPECLSTDLRSGGIRYNFYPSPIAPGAIAREQVEWFGLLLDPWSSVQCSNGHLFARTDLVFTNGSFAGQRPLMVIAADAFARGADRSVTAHALRAMGQLHDLNDRCKDSSAHSIVRSFLSNAATWRGPEARRIKAELRAMLKG